MPDVERVVSIDGAELWVAERGEGIPLLLINGGFGCADYLGGVADLVEDLGSVIRFESRGCGRSSREGTFELDEMLADLEGLRESLGVDRWVVLGHSAGADLALAYAVEHPDSTLGVIHLCGTGVQNDRDWKAAYEAGVEAGRNEPPFEIAWNREVNQKANASWRRWIKGPDLLRRLADLEVPFLFLYGERDIRPSFAVQQVANLLPVAAYVEVAGADHWPWITHPHEIRHAVTRFLQTIDHVPAL